MLRFVGRLLLLAMFVSAGLIQVVKIVSRAQSHAILAFIMTEEVYDIYFALQLYDARTGISQRFTPDNQRIYDFVWSPDGRQLLYQNQSHVNEPLALYLAGISPRHERLILTDALHGSALPMSWSATRNEVILGRQISYISPNLSLQMLDMDDGSLREIDYENATLQASMAEWLPDGENMLIQDNFVNADYRFALLAMETGSEPVGLPSSFNVYRYVIALPDNSGYLLRSEQEIAFASMDNPAQIETLITGAEAYPNMALSPDGQSLAYIEIRSRVNLSSAISLLNMHTGETREVTVVRGIVLDVAWSSDGEWLAYSYLPTRTGQSYHVIYIVRPDGSQEQLIASGYMQNFHRRYLQWQP